MKRSPVKHLLSTIVASFLFLHCGSPMAEDGSELWLRYRPVSDGPKLVEYRGTLTAIVVPGRSATMDLVRKELHLGLGRMLGKEIPAETTMNRSNVLMVGTRESFPAALLARIHPQLEEAGPEGFGIFTSETAGGTSIVIVANHETGALRGTFHFLRLLQTQQSIDRLAIVSKPRIQYRLLNHWDNLDGSVERGYAGKSLWKWEELPGTIDPRYHDYARANASLGLNGVVLNNVNANPDILKSEYLRKVAALADVFRPYGIRMFLSANFSSPISEKFEFEARRRGGIGDLGTADPLDPHVRSWWKNKVSEIYRLIPDFGGFLVKASSEGMPGPNDYGRTHAEGANMLAEVLEPYGGIVMWRSFVYDADVDPDRTKRAYKEFVPLDGKFHSNVSVQPKNGPLDFQPREPVNPLFGAMPKTPLMLELQITQEYLGHSTHLVYLAPMWKEYLQFDTHADGAGSTLASIVDGSVHGYLMTGIAGVANTGDDRNWTGHFFAQANWYAFGRLAWDHTLSSEELAVEWIGMSLGNDSTVLSTVHKMMMGSWEACVQYMTPLGLHHIMQEHFHYGPEPSLDKGREDWTSVYYHRASTTGIGYNRNSSGSNAVSQYFSPVSERFDDLTSCPEEYLLWFHHISWDYRTKSGRTVWDELCHRYHSGVKYVAQMQEHWRSLQQRVDPVVFQRVDEKLAQHVRDAGIWRDTCLTYFQRFSGKPIVGDD